MGWCRNIRIGTSSALLACIGLVGNPAHANDADEQKTKIEQLQELVAEDIRDNVWTNFLSVADQSFSGDNKQLFLDFQDGVYRLNFDLGTKNNVQANSRRAVFTTFSLNGSVPVSNKDTQSKLPTLNALANGSTLKLTFSRTIVPFQAEYWTDDRINVWTSTYKSLAIAEVMSGTASATCLEATSWNYYARAYGRSKANDTPKEVRIAELQQLINDGQLPAYTDKAGLAFQSVDKLLPTDEGTVIACMPKTAARDFWIPAESDDLPWIHSFGASATIGQEDFSYTDVVTFGAQTATETTYAFSAFGRLERGNDLGGTSISAAIELQHAFKENDPSTVCRDPDDMATCVEAVFGPPQAEDSFVAKVSYASVLKGITILGDKPVALSLNANYNIDNDVWGLEAPVFLYRDDKNLGAGVRAGWRSDTDNFEVGFFVSHKFSF